MKDFICVYSQLIYPAPTIEHETSRVCRRAENSYRCWCTGGKDERLRCPYWVNKKD